MIGKLVLFGVACTVGYLGYLVVTAIITGGEDYELDPETIPERTAAWDEEDLPDDYYEQRSERTVSNSVEEPSRTSLSEQTRRAPSQTSQFDISETEFDWQHDSEVGFADVGGMSEVKQELYIEVIKPLEQKQKAEKLGVSAPNIVFHGPPGTGKTYMAEALATELGLPFAQLSGADLQSKWINESAQKVNELFTEAKQVSRHEGGAVVFLDELDSVLKERSAGTNTHEEDTKVVNEFLNHLEGTKDHDIIFIGATNRLEALDGAGIRSGRIDKKIHIGKPDIEAREAILQSHIEKRKHDISADQLRSLAVNTEGLVPADLAQAVDRAAKRALARDDTKITATDLRQGFQSLVESGAMR